MSGDHKTIIKGNPSQYVKLNVGGHFFYTTIATLTAKADTMLQAMFSGRMEVLTDSEGRRVIACEMKKKGRSDHVHLFFRLDTDRSLWNAFRRNIELLARWNGCLTRNLKRCG